MWSFPTGGCDLQYSLQYLLSFCFPPQTVDQSDLLTLSFYCYECGNATLMLVKCWYTAWSPALAQSVYSGTNLVPLCVWECVRERNRVSTFLVLEKVNQSFKPNSLRAFLSGIHQDPGKRNGELLLFMKSWCFHKCVRILPVSDCSLSADTQDTHLSVL